MRTVDNEGNLDVETSTLAISLIISGICINENKLNILYFFKLITLNNIPVFLIYKVINDIEDINIERISEVSKFTPNINNNEPDAKSNIKLLKYAI